MQLPDILFLDIVCNLIIFMRKNAIMQQSDAYDCAKYQRAGQSAQVRRASFTEQDLKDGGAN